MATYYLRQNDAKLPMTAYLKEADGTALDLTGITKIEFHVGTEGDVASKLLDALAGVIGDPTHGEVLFTWLSTQTILEMGTYDGEFEITWPSGMIRTIPTRSGQFQIVVVGEVA